MVSHMNNTERWNQYLEALNLYTQRTGNARVPASHIEHIPDGTVVNLGAWVGYIRQRHERDIQFGGHRLDGSVNRRRVDLL